MKNFMKKLGIAIFAMAMIWSCGKDDAPTPPKNAAPVIIAQEFTVKADIADTVVIGTVTATDADKDALTFSIKTNDDDLFAITSGGALTLAQGKSLDFATKAQHNITVEVSDGEDSATATITIKVTEVAPQNSAPEIADQEFTVAEDITDADSIGVVTATDNDGDNLVFSMMTNDNDLFLISEAGELYLANGKNLDFETATQHSITVQVSDGTATAQATVTIKVEDVEESLASDPNAFVTTWKTETDNEEIIIGTNQNLTYDYTIDWGDGTVEEINTSDPPSHFYATAGNHTVAILGQFPHLLMSDNGGTPLKLLSLDQWGNIQWEVMSGAFVNCAEMIYKATDMPDLSQVTLMNNMFKNASKFNGDIGDWDTSNVTNMSSMFHGATSFDQNIGGWDTSNVIDMSSMFQDATAFNGDISGWDTSSNTTFFRMFSGATTFDQPIGGWDTSNANDMFGMFNGATSFNQNINTWDTSNVISMGSMFNGATSFDQGLNLWDTSSVTTMASMFRNATAFNGLVTGWDTSNVTTMANMFNGASSFNGTLSEFNLASVTNMTGMLDNCGMNTLFYSMTLIGWSNDDNTPSDIVLGATGLTICGNNAGATAYVNLITNKGWTINDESGQCF